MTIGKTIMGVGIVALLVLNPFTVNIISDALIIVIDLINEYLVLASGYIIAIAGTLVLVGLIVVISEHKQADNKKLKKLKTKKTQKAGKFIEAK